MPVAFALALLLNAQIKGRKFFRVAFLLPLMLSPVAVSWMIGKSMLENRFGPIARMLREMGVDNPSFFSSPEIARLMIMLMDAWTYIPFMMIMILAGLQAIPKELHEAAEVDGASAWTRFWEVTFPLDAASVDHRYPDPHYFQIKACGYYYQYNLRRTGRRHR